LGGFQTYNPKLFDERNTKGGHVLLDAWKKVENQIGKSTLMIGGPGTNKTLLNKWRSALQRPEAVFFSDAVTPQIVPGLLRACEIVVIPSLNEGLPNLANEAQAVERPVIGSDAGGIPESVIHGETGWIVPKGDPISLADGLIWSYEHQDEIPRLGANGRKHMIRDFNEENASIALFSLFNECIANNSSRKKYYG
jgi:glycosyltransferase involved in cell wall biosynthesis